MNAESAFVRSSGSAKSSKDFLPPNRVRNTTSESTSVRWSTIPNGRAGTDNAMKITLVVVALFAAGGASESSFPVVMAWHTCSGDHFVHFSVSLFILLFSNSFTL